MSLLANLPSKLSKIFGPLPAATSHVTAILDGLAAKNSEKLDWRNSIVDLMKLVDMDSSLDARKEFAIELGFPGDLSDSLAMNIFLLNRLIIKIVEARYVSAPPTQERSTSNCYKSNARRPDRVAL